MGEIKDQLTAFDEAIDNAWDELSMLDEALYNMGLSYEDYALFYQDIDHIIDCLNQLSSEVRNKFMSNNSKLDYTE